MQVLRPGQHVLERLQPQRRGRVLHGQHVLELRCRDSATSRAAVLRGECSSAATSRLRGGSRPASRCASSLSAQDTCQTAAPGSDTVGIAGSRARSPYSASSHLMKSGSDRPTSRDHLRGDQAHPPAVVVDVDAAVQPRGLAQVPPAEVVAGFVSARRPTTRCSGRRSRRRRAAPSGRACRTCARRRSSACARRSANASARRMPSGSTAMSSSSSSSSRCSPARGSRACRGRSRRSRRGWPGR